MLRAILLMILAARPGLPDAQAQEVACTIHHAIVVSRRETKRIVDPAVVVAIAFTESRFDPSACRDESNGSSSRGLFQVNVPRSRCGDGQRPDLYNPRRNAREGVRILAAWMRATRHLPEALRRYNGRGKAAEEYARTVLGRAVALQKAMERRTR